MPASTLSTYLISGQRYAPAGSPAWRVDHQLTILRVGRDWQGVLRVAYQGLNGHQIVEPTSQFEAAVANGQLVPVVGPGFLARC